MALFQPTNVIPSTLSGEGNGTVDVTQTMNVSWYVNGNSPMLAYRIKIMQNDTDSTLKLDTGKVSLYSPFFGADRMGNPRAFTTAITPVQMANAGMVNGYANGYKMTIQQWWGADDSVEQTSASYFITRTAPVLIMGSIPYQNSFRHQEFTFSANYFQAQSDAVTWSRWELEAMGEGSTEYTLIDDTGYIYNAEMTYYSIYSVLHYTYNGFSIGTSGDIGVPGVSYRIRCTLRTESGVEATTGWENFSTMNIASFSAPVLELCNLRDTDAIKIRFRKNFPLLAETEGAYTFTYDNGPNYGMRMDAGATAKWGGEGEDSLDIQASPYVIVFKGDVTDASAPTSYMTAHYTDGDLVFSYTAAGFFIRYGGNTLWGTDTVPANGDTFAIALLDNTVYFYLNHSGNVTTKQEEIPDWQGKEMQYIVNRGPLYFRGTTINEGSLGWEDFYLYAGSDNRFFDMQEETLFILSYNYTLFTGSNTIGSRYNVGDPDHPAETTGLSIYKKEIGSLIFNLVADITLDADTKNTVILDYAVKNNIRYEYYTLYTQDYLYMFARDGISAITPCFWNYTVLCCEENNIGDYIVKSEYRFALDIASGNVGNNNTPSLQQNFTRYPLRQPVSSRYRSGTLTAFIGKAENGNYVDSVNLMDELYALSTDERPKFLKTRKGQLLRIETSGPVVMNIGDKFAQQPAKISLPWVETGSTEKVKILDNSIYISDVPTFIPDAETMEIKMLYSEKSLMGEDSFMIAEQNLYLVNPGIYDEKNFSMNEKMEVTLDID